MDVSDCRAPAGALVAGGRLAFGLAATIAALGIASPALAGGGVASWTMPLIAVPEAQRPPQPNVFGTVALPVRARQATTRWTKLMRASLNQPALIRLVAPARGLSPHEQASFVQAAVNRSVRSGNWSYDCSDDGYWAASGETLNRGKGDCMDIVIAKMEALRSLGFADKDLYLTTGYYHAGGHSGRGQGAAALLVRIGEGFWLLSEQSRRLIDAGGGYQSAEFIPYITYGYGQTWVHGRLLKTTRAEAELAVRDVGEKIVSLAR